MSAERERLAEERAWRAGAGQTVVDSDDEDMLDAVLLATPDAAGGVLWHPRSLQDIYDLPDRVLRLYLAYRSGQANRARPQSAGYGEIGGVPVKGA